MTIASPHIASVGGYFESLTIRLLQHNLQPLIEEVNGFRLSPGLTTLGTNLPCTYAEIAMVSGGSCKKEVRCKTIEEPEFSEMHSSFIYQDFHMVERSIL